MKLDFELLIEGFYFFTLKKKEDGKTKNTKCHKMLTKLFRLAPFRSLEGMCKRPALEIERDLPSIRFRYR